MNLIDMIPGWECAAKATHAVELYSAKDGRAHGDLSLMLYVCPMHLGAGREEEWQNRRHAERVTSYTLPITLKLANTRSCGALSDYRDVTEEESVDWIKRLWPGGAVPDGSPVVEEPSGYPTVTVECAGHVLLSGSLQKYALKGQIAAPEGHELLTFVYRDPFDPADPTAERPVRRARLVVEELGIIADVETQDVGAPTQDVGDEWESLPGVTDTYPSTSAHDNAQHVEDYEDEDPPGEDEVEAEEDRADDRWYLLHIDSSVIEQGPFPEIRAKVAERVTEWLADDPVWLASDAQMLNLAFTAGDVVNGINAHGEWSTQFGMGTHHHHLIRVTREDKP
jgi:hypothetical protein